MVTRPALSGGRLVASLAFAMALSVGSGCDDGGADATDVDAGNPIIADAALLDANVTVDATNFDGAVPDAAQRNFTVVFNTHQHSASGDEITLQTIGEINQVGIQLFSPDLLIEYVGQVEAGRMTFSDIADGPVYVRWRLGSANLLTENDTLNLSDHRYGSSTAISAIDPTNILVSATNMQSWQEGDIIQLHSQEAGITIPNAEANNSIAGASLVDMPVNMFGAPLLEASDQLLVTHLSITTGEVRDYRRIVESFLVAAPDMSDGQNSTVSGTFSVDTTDNKTLALVWNPSTYPSLFMTAIPELNSQFYTRAQIDATSNEVAYSPDLLFYGQTWSIDTNLVSLSMPYQDPYPATYERRLILTSNVINFQTMPSGTTSFAQQSWINNRVSLATPSSATDLSLLTGPIENLKIGGLNAFDGSAVNVGETPMVSWQAPAVGSVGIYTINLFELTEDLAGNVTDTTEFVASFIVAGTATEFAMPAGFMNANKHYIFQVVTLTDADSSIDRMIDLAAVSRYNTEAVVNSAPVSY